MVGICVKKSDKEKNSLLESIRDMDIEDVNRDLVSQGMDPKNVALKAILDSYHCKNVHRIKKTCQNNVYAALPGQKKANDNI